MWPRTSPRALLIAAGELGKGGRGGTRHATCPCAGEGAGAAKAHGEGREGDEQGLDEQERLTETRGARGREEETDRGEEGDNAHRRPLFDQWHGSKEKKMEGQRGPGGVRDSGMAVEDGECNYNMPSKHVT